jgi:CPA2 family monovalent cation:H+ antiporter-2
MRRLFIQWILQLALNFALLTGVFIVAAWAGTLPAVQVLEVPRWIGGPEGLVWFAGLILALPLLVALLRKLRAIAMVIAEASVTRAAAGQRTAVLRVFVASTLLALGFVGVLLWGLALTSAILPPWPILVILVMLVIAIAFTIRKSLIRVYAQAQIQIKETLEPEVPEPAAQASLQGVFDSPAPLVLTGAGLRQLAVEVDSPAEGKLIRELALRTATGASIVAIDRDHTPIINPGPDEELRYGDRVYLLGTREQLERATSSFQNGIGRNRLRRDETAE